MSYQTGLSGLAASSSNLDVIGNNIANANTVGFKQGSAVFSDLYAGSLASAVGQQIGIGTAMAEVQQQFSQGSITTTNQALNIAINGPGFFMVNQAGSTVYSRNGVFQLDKDGYIVNAQGGQLTGYQANAQGLVQTATAVPLRVPTGNVAPKATQNVNAAFNLNAMDNLMLNTPTAAAGANTGTGTIGGVTITDPTAGTNADKYTVTFGAGGTTYSVVDSTTE
jgi:flagellar hook protein FlgE